MTSKRKGLAVCDQIEKTILKPIPFIPSDR
jgi:hypothetical protein